VAVDRNECIPDLDGKTALQKEIDYFGDLMNAYAELSVTYQGRPLLWVDHGAPAGPID
jgi:hypothetical protein